MVEYGKSILEQYHFIDGDESKMRGGYPIRNLLESEQNRQQILGGGIFESIGIDKFNDYAIPIGLLSFKDTPNQFKNIENKSSKREPECISDDLFDRLFSSVTKQNKKHNTPVSNVSNVIVPLKNSQEIGDLTAKRRKTKKHVLANKGKTTKNAA
jgi:hypothetical protein